MPDIIVPNQLPEVSDEEIRKGAVTKQVAKNTYARWVVTKEERTVTKEKVKDGKKTGGNFCLVLTCAPLSNPEDPTSKLPISVQLWLNLPMANPSIEGHVAPIWGTRQIAATLPALFPDELPSAPVWDKAENAYRYSGSEFAGEMKDNLKYLHEKTCLPMATAIWEKKRSCLNKCFYAKYSENNGYTGLAELSAEQDPTVSLSESVIDDGAGKEAEFADSLEELLARAERMKSVDQAEEAAPAKKTKSKKSRG